MQFYYWYISRLRRKNQAGARNSSRTHVRCARAYGNGQKLPVFIVSFNLRCSAYSIHMQFTAQPLFICPFTRRKFMRPKSMWNRKIPVDISSEFMPKLGETFRLLSGKSCVLSRLQAREKRPKKTGPEKLRSAQAQKPRENGKRDKKKHQHFSNLLKGHVFDMARSSECQFC